jgi:hypothetical protein
MNEGLRRKKKLWSDQGRAQLEENSGTFPVRQADRSYAGLIPSEDSSAGHQRLGHITKQGSTLLRFLLGEAAQAAARCDAGWRRRYAHLALRRQRNIAKVAMARRLAVLLYWMVTRVSCAAASSRLAFPNASAANLECQPRLSLFSSAGPARNTAMPPKRSDNSHRS